MAEFHTYDPQANQNQQAVPNGLPRLTPGGFYGDVWRETAAAARRLHDDLCGRLRATGSGGNYVVSTSRAIDLTRGVSLKFRANHENPAAGPTLLGRPLTYADGSTIPAGAIKSGQLLDVAFDGDNNRWNLSIMPGAAATSGGTVTGDKLSLQGEAQGSVAIRAGSAWIASAAGTATQFFRGGANPGFATPTGLCLLAGRITAGTNFTPKGGLAHTATISRLGVGRYRLNVSPALPSPYFVATSAHCDELDVVPLVVVRAKTTTTIELTRNARSDGSAADISGTEAVDVVVF